MQWRYFLGCLAAAATLGALTHWLMGMSWWLASLIVLFAILVNGWIASIEDASDDPLDSSGD